MSCLSEYETMYKPCELWLKSQNAYLYINLVDLMNRKGQFLFENPQIRLKRNNGVGAHAAAAGAAYMCLI